MLILIILGCLFLIGIGFLIGGHIANRDAVIWNDIEWPYYVGASLAILSAIALVVVGINVALIQTNKELDYQNTLEKYNMITYKLENNSEMSGLEKESIMCSIKLYNEKIRTANYYKDNPWLNCFYNDKLVELPYISWEDITLNYQ